MKFKMFSLIAMVMLALTITATAESTVTSDNGLGTETESASNQAIVMAVNPGDKIIITVEGATDAITLMSYKGGNPVIENMQYINQYPQETGTITYEIRDINSTQNGLYLLMINDGTNVSSFYYKVGRPELVTGEGVNYFTKVDFGKRNDEFTDTTSIAYLASFTPAGGTVTRYGFNVKNDSTGKSADVGKDESISGGAVFEFGITIYNLETSSIEEILSNLVVIPYVNYAE